MNPSTYAVLARVSPGYPPLPGRLPTCYSPVRRSPAAEATFAHDLHVLSTPPAFILSQDQTLHLKCFHSVGSRRWSPPSNSSEILFFDSGSSRLATGYCFLRKAAKIIDVWHALLSFQGTESPDASHPLETPYFRRSWIETAVRRRKFQFLRFWSLRQLLFPFDAFALARDG